MANRLVIYTVLHQPRRVRLPAVPLPRGASALELSNLMFDHDLNQHYFEKVAHWCYRPALAHWHRLLDDGLALALGIPLSTIMQFEEWAPDLLGEITSLVRHPHAELIAVEPFHALTMLIDLPTFLDQMRLARTQACKVFGVEPTVADTTEMIMSTDIYHALQTAGYRGAFLDGKPSTMEWRDPTHLYHHKGGALRILPRHFDLSDDVGYRFSDRNWDGWPLKARDYATSIQDAPGELVILAWDFETFGEHHNRDSGIFDFLEELPEALAQSNIACITPTDAINTHGHQPHELPLSPFPSTWAGVTGSLDFFMGNDAQRSLYRLMTAAFGAAKLTGDQELIEIAFWLMQSDNLHWLQWVGQVGPDAEVSAYFTPQEWMALGTDRLVSEHQRVYINFLEAIT